VQDENLAMELTTNFHIDSVSNSVVLMKLKILFNIPSQKNLFNLNDKANVGCDLSVEADP